MTLATRPRRDWGAIRDRIDLVAVATRLLGAPHGRPGEHSQGRFWWVCPFHGDRNPSFVIEAGKPWWKCYGCGEHGDAAALVMKHERLSFPEALAYLDGDPARHGPAKAPKRPATAPKPSKPATPSGMPESEALALVEDAERRLWSPEGSEALTYLTGPRRLNVATIRAGRLGWTPRADGVPFRPRGIVIPWFAGGRLAMAKVRCEDAWREGYSGRRKPPKYLEGFRDPARLDCYPGLGAIRPGSSLIVVEGEFDALILGQELGPMASVATLGPASNGPPDAVLSVAVFCPAWYIATDADDAGDKAFERWPFSRARRVRPPGSFKDWTEALVGRVNLARWWGDILAGIDRPSLYTWEELATWRWGGATEADANIIVDRPRGNVP